MPPNSPNQRSHLNLAITPLLPKFFLRKPIKAIMHRFLISFALAITTLHAERPNILFIAIDDLRPDLASFGAKHIHSPAIDSLAASGRPFHHHYVQAPTCGSSRFVLLTGRYAETPSQRDNNALFDIAKKPDETLPSLPLHFRNNGYNTVSIGKISHNPGGLGGPQWNDPEIPELPGAWDHHSMPTQPWAHPHAAMHGYANGEARIPGKTPAIYHQKGNDKTYTDGWITAAAISQMDTLSKQQKPFFLAVGIMKPHLPFACPQSYLDLYKDTQFPPTPHPMKPAGRTTWQPSGEFRQNYGHNGRNPATDPIYADQVRRSYAACVSYADAQVAKLIEQLDSLDLSKNTIVILWSDHGFHLGEHSVWGKHTLFEESLLAPLIIRTPSITSPGTPTKAIVETTDIYPTLCELAAIPSPSFLRGKSLTPQLKNPTAPGRPAISYFRQNETIRTETHRLIRHRNPAHYELYDHTTPERETLNIAADHPELVKQLSTLIDARLNPPQP